MLNDKKVVRDLEKIIEEGDESAFPVDAAKMPKLNVMRAVLSGEEVPPGADPTGHLYAEAIIKEKGRPALLIQDGQYEEPILPTVKNRLDPHKDKIVTAIKSVARLELLNHNDYAYVGTAWMIAPRIMVTNRHVADIFARQQGGSIKFRTNNLGQFLKPQVDFREEYQRDDAFEVPIIEVLYIESDVGYQPDVAFIQVKEHNGLPDPINLSSQEIHEGDDVAVIGYPARDFRNDADIMHDIFKGIYEVKRLSPGWISDTLPDRFVFSHDCSTLGGNSGSVVIDITSGEAVGLHFSGRFKENNFAVKARTILNRLQKITPQIHVPSSMPEIAEEEAAPTIDDLSDRQGYDPKFLDKKIPLPKLKPNLKKKLVTVDDSPNGLLNYTHYSVAMHEDRRLAMYVACNIDGNLSYNIRRGRDKWYFDPRIDREFQAGNDLYKSNPLDRGHLVRRLDPAWGETRNEAYRGNDDTFFWTNCSPQHADFNQSRWLELENYILSNADNKDLKITVFTGPIFKNTDKEYRGYRIPEDYWKVVAMIRSDTDQLSVTGYMVSQKELIDDMEFVYGAFRTYQVPVARIENLTGIDFGNLKNADPLGNQESQPFVRIASGFDIIL